jgi:nicotinamidase/pyrazinamidase
LNISDTAFFDIDTQNDFLNPKGSLYIKDSENIKFNLKELIKFAEERNITIVSTMDSHIENDPEFADFAPHCIPGTWGWKKIPETTYPDYQVVELKEVKDLEIKSNRIIIKKRELDFFKDPRVVKIIKVLNKQNFIVFGVATDYCVKSAGLGLLKENFSVYLVEDAIKGINIEKAQNDLKIMLDNGATLIKTEEVIRLLS